MKASKWQECEVEGKRPLEWRDRQIRDASADRKGLALASLILIKACVVSETEI